jgi:hypothetical protein
LTLEIYKEEYFDKYSIELDISCEIHQSEKMYIDKIAEFYDLKYFSIENEEVIKFFDSITYQKYYDEKICYKILKTMKEYDIVEFFMGCKFIKDIESCFRKPENLFILEDEEDRFILNNVNDKYEIHDNLKKFVLNMEGNLNLFLAYKIDIINENYNFLYFIINLPNIYNKGTSKKIIRIIIRRWCENSEKDSSEDENSKEENSKLIEKIQNLYFLTEDGEFHHPYVLILELFTTPRRKLIIGIIQYLENTLQENSLKKKS